MSYQVAIGFNNAAGLADISPQPKSSTVYRKVEVAVDQTVQQVGFDRIILYFSALTAGELNTVLSAFGLSFTTLSNEVTVSVPVSADRTFSNYNAVAQFLKVPQFSMGVWKGVEITLVLEEAL